MTPCVFPDTNTATVPSGNALPGIPKHSVYGGLACALGAAQRGRARQYDHTSILKMIEDRWGLPRLTVRDATANSLAEVLDFNRPDVNAPRFSVSEESYERLCPLPDVLTLDGVLGDEWKHLHALARSLGFI